MKTLNKGTKEEIISEILPIIPTMDVVVFPHMIVPLLVLDERIINGINKALEGSKRVLLLAAKKKIDDYQGAIGTKDLYEVGTVSTIMRLIKIPEGGVKILVQGICKARVKDIMTDNNILNVTAETLIEDTTPPEELIAHIKNIKEVAEKVSASSHSFSPDFHIILSKMNDSAKIADFILSHLSLTVEEAQNLLETDNQTDFLEGILMQLNKEVEVAETHNNNSSSTQGNDSSSNSTFFC